MTYPRPPSVYTRVARPPPGPPQKHPQVESHTSSEYRVYLCYTPQTRDGCLHVSVVQVEPTKDHPFPTIYRRRNLRLWLKRWQWRDTAELQIEMGASLDISEGDAAKEKNYSAL